MFFFVLEIYNNERYINRMQLKIEKKISIIIYLNCLFFDVRDMEDIKINFLNN